jgi:hypothetical protein
MAPAHDFKLELTRAIEPTGGPGVELPTIGNVSMQMQSVPDRLVELISELAEVRRQLAPMKPLKDREIELAASVRTHLGEGYFESPDFFLRITGNPP